MKVKQILFISLLNFFLLGLVGCGGESDAGKNINYVTFNGSEPQRPLIPADTSEVGGDKIIGNLFSGLTYIDSDSHTHMDLAESINSDDQQHFVVTLRKGIKFSDGTPIKAEHFVRAWNQAITNSYSSGSFFTEIQGYQALRDKQATEMSGLKIIDGRTFTIDLNSPDSLFTSQLAYSAFFPLPDVAFQDMTAFGQNPVGSGPYKMAGPDAWAHNQSASLVVNEYYDGPRKAQNEGVKFIFYPTLTSAYADALSGQLDVLYGIPDEQLSSYQNDFSNRWMIKAAPRSASLGINIHTPHFGMDEEGRLRRAALSMAINRPEIITVLFNGLQEPAHDFSSPVVEGYSDNIQGKEVLSYQPEKAKELWKKADEINPYTGTLSISYNADGEHQSWVEAVINQWKNTLNVRAVALPIPDFKSFLEKMKEGSIPMAYRYGWVADYPSAYNFIKPIYSTDALISGGSNYSAYSNPKVDELLKSFSSENDPAAKQKYLDDAQAILMQDLPNIPLWVSLNPVVYGEKISNVELDWQGYPTYDQIQKR